MVAHRLDAHVGVDTGIEDVTDVDFAFDDAPGVARDARLHLHRVFDQHARTRIAQLAGVADLTAALGVERRVVEDNHNVVAGSRARDRRAVDEERRHACVLAHQVLVAVESGRDTVVLQPLRHLELARRARLFALAVHRNLKPD